MLGIDEAGLNEMFAERSDQPRMGFDAGLGNDSLRREQGCMRRIEHGIASAIACPLGVLSAQKHASGR